MPSIWSRLLRHNLRTASGDHGVQRDSVLVNRSQFVSNNRNPSPRRLVPKHDALQTARVSIHLARPLVGVRFAAGGSASGTAFLRLPVLLRDRLAGHGVFCVFRADGRQGDRRVDQAVQEQRHQVRRPQTDQKGRTHLQHQVILVQLHQFQQQTGVRHQLCALQIAKIQAH